MPIKARSFAINFTNSITPLGISDGCSGSCGTTQLSRREEELRRGTWLGAVKLQCLTANIYQPINVIPIFFMVFHLESIYIFCYTYEILGNGHKST